MKKIKPKAGQESVWDYPRPPRLDKFNGHIRIVFNKIIILDTNEAFRIVETSHPPTYYLPIRDFHDGVLQKAAGISFCEFKGSARYYDIILKGKSALRAAWQYPNARGAYATIKDCVAVYAHLMDTCFVNDEPVKAQEGDFYGGWITSNIVGPFKGAREPGAGNVCITPEELLIRTYPLSGMPLMLYLIHGPGYC